MAKKTVINPITKLCKGNNLVVLIFQISLNTSVSMDGNRYEALKLGKVLLIPQKIHCEDNQEASSNWTTWSTVFQVTEVGTPVIFSYIKPRVESHSPKGKQLFLLPPLWLSLYARMTGCWQHDITSLYFCSDFCKGKLRSYTLVWSVPPTYLSWVWLG